MKQKPFELKTLRYEDIDIRALTPHPDAEAFWHRQTDEKKVDEDQAAITGDIEEHGIIEPLVVSERDGFGRCQILDGVSRYMAACALGIKMVPCQIVEIDPSNIRRLILAKNSMRHKLTTGQRILRWMETNKDQVLDAWEKGHESKRSGGVKSNDSTPFHTNAIARTLGVSNKDVIKGIELLASMANNGLPKLLSDGTTAIVPFEDEQEPVALRKVYRDVLLGKTPIRRWFAAFGGAAATEDQERPATNYARIIAEAAKALLHLGNPDVWLPIDPALKSDIYVRLGDAILAAPDDIIHVIKTALATREGGNPAPKKGKKA